MKRIEGIKEKFKIWKMKTFTEKNIKKFFLVQIADAMFVLLFLLAIIERIPLWTFILYSFGYAAVFIAKKLTHTITSIKETMNQKK